MITTKRIAHRIRTTLESSVAFFVQFLEKELTLPSVKAPELNSLKKSHQKLLAEYVHVLSATSKLPFFMSPIQRVHLETKLGLFIRLFMLALASANPMRLITLRPMVILAIEMHIRKKLGELEIAYAQLKFIVPNDDSESGQYLEWLEKAGKDCSALKSTVSSGKIIIDAFQFLAIPAVTLLAAVYGVNGIYELLAKVVTSPTSSDPFFLVGLALILAIIYIYISVFVKNTFVAKRSILLSTEDVAGTGSVYSLENHLFQLIGKKKSREFSSDFFVATINHLALIVFAVFVALEVDKASASAIPNSTGITVYINCFWGFVVAIVINMLIVVLMPWSNRVRSEEV